MSDETKSEELPDFSTVKTPASDGMVKVCKNTLFCHQSMIYYRANRKAFCFIQYIYALLRLYVYRRRAFILLLSSFHRRNMDSLMKIVLIDMYCF